MTEADTATIPSVSVIIPTKDRCELLAQTLRTVLAQDVPLEVVVVDDGSTDGTAEWLEGLDDHRVRLVRRPRPQGPSTARNAGIAASAGDWIAFVDDDDLWLPRKLSQQLEAAARAAAPWAYAGCLSFTGRADLLGVRRPSAGETDWLPWRNVVPAGGSNVVARRSLLEQVGGFRPEVPSVADWDMWIRLQQRAAPAVLSTPLVAYRVHEGGMSRDHARLRSDIVVLDHDYRHLRGGEPLDWDDAHRWMWADALRSRDYATARRHALRMLRGGQTGAIRRLGRALIPIRPRPPVTEPIAAPSLLDRVRPPHQVEWPEGTQSWLEGITTGNHD